MGFCVLILVLPAPGRRRSTLVATVGVILAGLPFVVADPMTLALGRFTIDNAPDSALRALGVLSPGTSPWDRPAQLALGVLVGYVCLRRGRWAAIPLAVVTARLLLDPQTYPYYSSGLLVCAAAADLLTPGRRRPLWCVAAAGWYLADGVAAAVLPPQQSGVLRALFCVAVLMTLCLLPSQHRFPAPVQPEGAPDSAANAPSATASYPLVGRPM